MQIGHGKEGVIIGEYEVGHPSARIPMDAPEGTKPLDTNPVLGYVEPACDNPQWILWFMADGNAILHQKRSETGGVEDEPLKIKSR